MRRRLKQLGVTALVVTAADAWLWVLKSPVWTYPLTAVLIGIAVSELWPS